MKVQNNDEATRTPETHATYFSPKSEVILLVTIKNSFYDALQYVVRSNDLTERAGQSFTYLRSTEPIL